jgi:Glycosyltransferase family 87
LLLSIYQPKLMLSSDYVMDFYPAGRLVLDGRALDLYRLAPSASLAASTYNLFAHQLLPDLPTNQVSIYMYSPLTAILFSLFAGLKPQISLIVWQITSIVAYAVSIFIVSAAVNQDFKKYFWFGLLYFPVFQTLLIGQLGIIAGLLPLSLGYVFLIQNRYLLAGLSWSFLLAKPQFLPIALLVSVALAINKKYQCALGLILGILLLVGFSSVLLTPAVFFQWLNSFKMSDSIFSDSRYSYPSYMITSLPAALLHFFPIAFRNAIKIPAYLLAFIISLHALWLGCRIIKSTTENNKTALSSVFMIGIAVLPMILPHFLFYDFCAFALFAVLFGSTMWTGSKHWRLATLNWLYIFILDVYHVLFYSPMHWILQPSLLILVMAFLYWRLLSIVYSHSIVAGGLEVMS